MYNRSKYNSSTVEYCTTLGHHAGNQTGSGDEIMAHHRCILIRRGCCGDNKLLVVDQLLGLPWYDEDFAINYTACGIESNAAAELSYESHTHTL
jgi:hypothetical protein